MCHLSDAGVQATESRLAVAYAVARQWFGVLIRPRTPADSWLVEGLAGYLHDLFLRRFLGKNELRYRCPSFASVKPHLQCHVGLVMCAACSSVYHSCIKVLLEGRLCAWW